MTRQRFLSETQTVRARFAIPMPGLAHAATSDFRALEPLFHSVLDSGWNNGTVQFELEFARRDLRYQIALPTEQV